MASMHVDGPLLLLSGSSYFFSFYRAVVVASIRRFFFLVALIEREKRVDVRESDVASCWRHYDGRFLTQPYLYANGKRTPDVHRQNVIPSISRCCCLFIRVVGVLILRIDSMRPHWTHCEKVLDI